MLTRLPLCGLILFAAVATAILGFGVHWVFRSGKAMALYLVISVGCCLGMIGAGSLQYQHWSASQMLIMYTFSWLGLTVGFFPSRKLLRHYADEQRRGRDLKGSPYPAKYQAPLYISVGIMIILGFLLST
ncbi:hypothetical protein [Streptomyces murinus]|uniref:hypothetical protein n=1 Tax=Streptomyces murinus TaxID=33900 RepID=UPI0036ED1B51